VSAPNPVTTPTAVQQAVERLTTLAELNDSCEDGDPRNTTVSVRDLRTVLAALADAERQPRVMEGKP